MRLTKLSTSNLKIADTARILDKGCGYVIEVSLEGNIAYLHSRPGLMFYPTAERARQAIRRLRPDLEPTTI